MRILIQAPEGLKTKILEIADQYEDAIIDLDTCYGSCDIKDNEAIELKCDKIIHFGHNKLIESKVPVQYNELRQNLDFIPLLKQNIDKLPNKIGLVTSLQFLDSLESIKNYLESIGKKVFIGKSEKLYKGQILGCDIVAGKQIENKVECFLYFGSGKFHALGLALSTNKPVYVLNYEMKKLELLDTRKFPIIPPNKNIINNVFHPSSSSIAFPKKYNAIIFKIRCPGFACKNKDVTNV